MALLSSFTLGDLVATATLRIPPLGAEHPEHAQTILLEVVGSDTPSWTLAIQGRTHPNGTYTAVDYMQIWQAGAAALANTTLTVSDTTRRFYIIPVVAPFMQVVVTRTTGTLTILGSYSSVPFSQWLATSADAVPNLGRLKTIDYKGAPTLLVSDTTANDSDKTITVTAGKQWHILCIYVALTSTTTVGARHLTLRIMIGGNNVGFFRAIPTHGGASLTRHYMWLSGVNRETTVDGTDTTENNVYIPIPPDFWIDDTISLRIFDDQATDPAADDMNIYIVGYEHSD